MRERDRVSERERERERDIGMEKYTCIVKQNYFAN